MKGKGCLHNDACSVSWKKLLSDGVPDLMVAGPTRRGNPSFDTPILNWRRMVDRISTSGLHILIFPLNPMT